VYLPVALVLLVIGAITALPVVVGLAVRQTAFRADYAGITLVAELRDGWTLRWDRAVFVTWPDVEQTVIYPRPGFPAGSRARRIGIPAPPRHLPPDKVPAYIEFAEAELGEQVAIYLRPERWLTADLGPGAVPPGVT
jgi:hypothetical protein